TEGDADAARASSHNALSPFSDCERVSVVDEGDAAVQMRQSGMETSSQIDIEQGVELADVRVQPDPATIVKRSGDGYRPGDLWCCVGIGYGCREVAEKFIRRCVGVDTGSSHSAEYQPTGAHVDQGGGDVCATYLQRPDEQLRLCCGVICHRTYA